MTLSEIFEYMLAGVPDDYDISAGSFFYDLLYPVAEQIYFLQQKIQDLSTNTFALTAVGEYLDRKAAEQGLTRRAGTFARGTVRIYGNRGEIVNRNAKVAADNILFAIDETATIPEAGYVDVGATCIMVGSVGNVKVGEINRFPVTLPGLTAVENITEFTGGYPQESDVDLLERYIEKVSHPTASGNIYHYIEWAKEVSGVGDVRVIPLWNGNGTVKVVIVDSDNQPAGEDLIEAVKSHIEEQRPIGAEVTVVSATALTINISVNIITDGSDGIQDAVEESIKGYLADEALKKSYVSYAKVGSFILSVAGVEDTTLSVKLSKDATENDIAFIRSLAGNHSFADYRESNRQNRGTYWLFNILVYGFLAIIALIAVFNIMNCISMSVSAKLKQYGAMRAIGMDSGQFTKMITAETITYATLGCLIGIAAGLPLNRQLFETLVTSHFGVPWTFPVFPVIIILILIAAASAAAVYAPSRRIKNMAVVEVIAND